ncbi:MAG: hypothetical protein ACLVB1_03000 [Blautia obeum]
MIGEKHKGSDIKTEKQFAEKIYQTGNGKSNSGDCDQSAGNFSAEIFLYEGQRRLKKKVYEMDGL